MPFFRYNKRIIHNTHMDTHIPEETPLLTWEAPEHPHHHRTRNWYICAGLCVFGCFAYSIYTAAWSFLIVMILCTGLYYYTHKEKPPHRRIRIWKRGFAMNNDYNEWKECAGYYMLKYSDYTDLYIETKLGRTYRIQTGDVNPFTIHDTLSAITAELPDRREKILDTIIRICKL